MASRLPSVRFDRIRHLFLLILFIALAIALVRPRRVRAAPSTAARTALCRAAEASRSCRKGSSFSHPSAWSWQVFLFASHRLTTPATRLQHVGGDAKRRDSLSTRLALFICLNFGHDEASWAKTSDAKLVPQAYAKAYTSSAAKKPIPVID